MSSIFPSSLTGLLPANKYYKIVLLAAVSGGVVLILYRNQHFLIRQYKDAIGSNQQLHQLNTEMLENLRATHESIFILKEEIANLKNQVTFARESRYYRQNSMADGHFSDISEIDNENGQAGASSQRSVSLRTRTSRKIRSSKSASSYKSGQTFPDSDDDVWQSPDEGELTPPEDFDVEYYESIQSVRNSTSVPPLKQFDFSRFSENITSKLPFINLNLSTYNPKPWSGLAPDIYNVCLQVDELHYKGDAAVIETFNSLESLVKNECVVDILWRLCRACLYLGALSKLEKDTAKFKQYILTGIDYSEQGLKILEETENYESDHEFKVTSAAPLYKWSAGVIGCSAEIVADISLKVKNGFKSKHWYTKALELDKNDYFSSYGLGRWHYEVYMLPSLLRRSANWISTEKYESTIQDCLDEIYKAIEMYPFEEPYTELPVDISVLLCRCYKEIGDTSNATKYIKLAKESIDTWPEEDFILKKLDQAEKLAVTKLYKQIV